MKLRKLIAILLTVGYVTAIVTTVIMGSSNIAVVDVSVTFAWMAAMVGLVKRGSEDH